MTIMKTLGVALSLAILTGCASTESLYAQYDELCPVEARVTNTGMVMVTGIAATGNGVLAAGESESQLWEPAVYFGFDRDELKDSEKARLDRNIAVLKRYEVLQLSVQAYTDRVGSNSHNDRLSRKRMDSVVAYLKQAGIGAGRIQATFLGEGAPLLSGQSRDERVINRRVELMPLDGNGRPLVMRADFANSGGDDFVAPQPVK
ncbi:MAG: OmpA family protein [Pseudomonadales bacterium]|nr:OmpA family protein [Pseudomonadales bacterium]